MKLPPADLFYLQEQLNELGSRVREAWEASARSHEEVDSPLLLSDALTQLFGHLSRLQDEVAEGGAVDATEISALGEYGLHLLDELSMIAGQLEQADLGTEIAHLTLPFALWIARNGGEVRSLAAVVNALAHFANQSSTPHVMSALYTCCCELVEASSPTLEDAYASDPKDPWRLLLLNRAIVATRSHNPELIEPAYDAIVELLPADAEPFFTQGMEQIAVINYPEPVRAIVRRYFLTHSKPRQLH